MSGKGGEERPRRLPRPRLVSPPAALATSLALGVGVLTSVYVGTNKDLTGWRYLVSIAFAACAIVLIVESFNRERAEERWRPIGGAGLGFALASLVIALLPMHGASGDGLGLRLELEPTPPEFFRLAFKRTIPLPAAMEDWGDLRRRGGIEVGDSHFRMTLSNDSSRPISVVNVRAEVLGSEPIPHGTFAYHSAQGDEGIDRFVTFLPGGRRGSVSQVYASSPRLGGREAVEKQTPFFEKTYVLLAPGEVDLSTLAVEAEARRTIEYRLVAEGDSANRHFVVKSRPFRIVGAIEDRYQQYFARYYALGHYSNECSDAPNNPWIDARYTRRSLACPFGPGNPYPTPPLKDSEYPRGELSFSLELAPGDQSAMISGVTVGVAPAADPIPGVVRPLLNAIGAWSSCMVFSPSTSYWTARWEPWDLEVTFASDGGKTDCTPSSRAEVRQIAVGEAPGRVDTDRGSIAIDWPGARVPEPIKRRAELAEGSEYEREYVIPGSSPCHPDRSDLSRFQLDGQPGGILAWSEDATSTKILSATATLPAGEC
jgi:hypothetical protein